VSMTFLALILLGVITSFDLPVSLLPSIDIPKITVQVSNPNAPAREIENTVVKPLRQQLMQLSNLKNIKSETRDGSGIIFLEFEYGTKIDYAFIETNEKIDRVMGQIPVKIEHPKVIKANATDIPVFYLNLCLKEEDQEPITNNELFPVSQSMVDLSTFSEQVIKKRMEQLPEVAMIDISGIVYSQILILPDLKKLESLNLSVSKLEAIIKNHNIDLGNLIIRDGQYQFNIRFSNTLKDKTDIENIYLKVDDRILQLKEIAQVIEHPGKIKGKILFNGKNAISMAVIKQSGAQIEEVKEKLEALILEFEKDYPHIEFSITRDQSQLLAYSISNLKQSLLWGTVLALLVMLFFLKDFKSPLLIGISIPVSLLLTLLFFYLADISINIISLSGLILGLGMMVDNSIIVIDNITQYKDRGYGLIESCIKGTNEVIRPLLSSILTTCAVFIPLVFVGGIAGSLFYEQAISITIGLFVSLAVSISLLPVYYKLIHIKTKKKAGHGFIEKLNRIQYNKIYEKGFHLVMRNQLASLLIVTAMIISSVFLYTQLKLERLPEMAKTETLLTVDWNQRINIAENEKRTKNIIKQVAEYITQNTLLIGEQKFLLDLKNTSSSAESVIYVKTNSPDDLEKLKDNISGFFSEQYPEALIEFEDAGNIFNIIFADNEANFIAKLRSTDDFGNDKNTFLKNNLQLLSDGLPAYQIPPPAFREILVLKTDPIQLALYDVAFEALYYKLQTALNEHEVYLISGNNQFMPVIIGDNPQTIREIIAQTMVLTIKGEQIPIRNILKEEKDDDLKNIIAGQEGEYYPVEFDIDSKNIKQLKQEIRTILKENNQFEADFSGSIFSNQKIARDLLIILLISSALLYFILAAQFESLSLPLIVLLEIPIDIFGAFVMLKIFGSSINLMSMIGIIVMSGIIINDSILKIDTINKLIENGYSLLHALVEAGHRRLKPILMTSLTTILALLPFLFTSGLGADLQKPLALAIIGGMAVGTIVSLYLIPLLYYYLKRKNRD
ncbi:MAG: efflux RND transporter permease subunit, partial [Bacteroidales bacterium]|nr:efflux RND transporter permease subunit [Bacteroidales bacterium]